MESLQDLITPQFIEGTVAGYGEQARREPALATLSTRFFRTRPADPSEERVRRYLETAVTRP